MDFDKNAPRTASLRRRPLLQALGMTAMTGVVAGCTASNGDDEPTDDGDDSEENDDDSEGQDTDDAIEEESWFHLEAIELSDETVIRGESFTVTATITNTESTGTQDVALEIDEEVMSTKETSIDKFQSVEVVFEDIATDDFAPGNVTVTVLTENDSEAATLTVNDPLSLSVSTHEATDVEFNGASLQGEAVLAGGDGSEGAEAWFTWGEVGADRPNETDHQSLFAGGSFSESLDGLAAETEYEFRAHASSDELKDEGETKTFSTEAPPEAEISYHWEMSEGAGDTVADVVGGQDGTIEGVTWVENDSFVGGYGLEGDGDGAYVELTDLPGTDFGENFAVAYTIEADTEDDAYVMGNRDSGGFHISYTWDWGDVLRSVGLTVDGEAGTSGDSGMRTEDDDLIVGGPHRVLVNKITNDPENWEVWIDGEEVPTEIGATGTDLDDNASFELGNTLYLFARRDFDGELDNELAGVLDNVIIFDNFLFESDIEEDYTNQPWAADSV